MKDSACLILRLGLGIMFCAHGLQKVFGMFNGMGIQGFTEFVSTLRVLRNTIFVSLRVPRRNVGGRSNLVLSSENKIAAFPLAARNDTFGEFSNSPIMGGGK